jgi:hypothetical protein
MSSGERAATGHRAGAAGQTSTLRIAISWVVVSIPLLWGVYQTLIKSLALFM